MTFPCHSSTLYIIKLNYLFNGLSSECRDSEVFSFFLLIFFFFETFRSYSFVLLFFWQPQIFSETNGPAVRHILQPCFPVSCVLYKPRLFVIFWDFNFTLHFVSFLESLDELRGVSRSFTSEPPLVVDLSSLQDNNKPAVPEFFHVLPTFTRSELQPSLGRYIQTLEAYFMVT